MLGLGVVRRATPSTVVRNRIEDESKSNGVPLSLSFKKPSWVSNVRKLARKKPEPPCIVCHGTGRVDCYNCSGKGRTNKTHLTMLPRGEWPKWCKTCSGGGLIYCSRCLGTGEYRYPMGFHFVKKSDSDSDGIKQHHNRRGQP
ncbi:hypothetical protein WN943_017938 [Citrus x changshan-huyou]